MILKNIEDTATLAKDVAAKLKGNELIFLNGDLGAGKTTFVKMLLKELGVKENVTSPTFAILKSYSSNIGEVYHVDAYRLDSVDDIYDEYYSTNLRIVEWADNIADSQDEANLVINIKVIDEHQREVELIWNT